MNEDKIKMLMEFFERLGECYINHLCRGRRPLGNSSDKGDPIEALCVFLEFYAFKKVGTNDPAAAKMAAGFIREKKNEIPDILRKNTTKRNDFWKKFKSYVRKGGKNLNEKSHPLNPQNSDKNDKNKFILDVLREDNGNGIKNIGRMALEALKSGEVGQIKEIHKILKSIRGIGYKIASFYLRDVALICKVEVPRFPEGKGYLLQPVDRWVKKTAKLLNKELPENNDKKIGEWIYRKALRLEKNPEKVNAGMWYYWVHVPGTEEQKREFLNKANQKLKEMAEGMNKLVNLFNKVLARQTKK